MLDIQIEERDGFLKSVNFTMDEPANGIDYLQTLGPDPQLSTDLER
jgi:hypothetical protein